MNIYTRIASFIRWCQPLITRFGWLSGCWIGVQLRRAWWAGTKGHLAAIAIPGWRQPIYMRECTSDALVFWQVFAEAQGFFPVDGTPRFLIDAGANVGLVSVCLANRFPESRIVALEIEDENFRMLEKNCASYPQITPMHMGLWSRSGHIEVVNPEAESWGFQTRESSVWDGSSIPALSVMDVLARFSQARVDLLKIDIEGGEYELFTSDSLEWVECVGTLVIEIHESVRPGVRDLVTSVMSERGFKVRRWSEYWIFSRQ